MRSVHISVLVRICLQLSFQFVFLAFQLADAATPVSFELGPGTRDFIWVPEPSQFCGIGGPAIARSDRDSGVETGRYLYGKPVQFRGPIFDDKYNMLCRGRYQDNATVSFSTTFFLMFEQDAYVAGSYDITRTFEGVAFIITPDAYTVGAGGGSLGLADVGASPSTSMSHTVVVELDMVRNPEFGDPEGVHIGIDVGNMTSLAVAPVGEDVYNRTQPHNWVRLWIAYHNPTRSLEIRISNWMNGSRPLEPSLVREIDLSKLVLDDMYVGFSAALRSCKEDYANSTNHTCARSVTLYAWRFPDIRQAFHGITPGRFIPRTTAY